MEERYECQNCFYTGPLDRHGQCGRCGSVAVVSEHIMPYVLEQNYERLLGEKA